MKRLMVGPFLGEFGWELFAWQAHWRWHKTHSDYKEIYVLCRPGREVIYQDYAIIGMPPAAYSDGSVVRGLKVFPANKEAVPYSPDRGQQAMFSKQEFVRYGKQLEGSPDIIMHARARKHRTGENYDPRRVSELADAFRSAGLTVGFIGTSAEAFDPDPGSEYSFLDLPLAKIVDILFSARCIVGPSSGPLHLASLCGCPQVVFSSARNHRRYKKDWNPFDTAVVFPPGKWQPTVEDAYASTMSLLDTLSPGTQK